MAGAEKRRLAGATLLVRFGTSFDGGCWSYFRAGMVHTRAILVCAEKNSALLRPLRARLQDGGRVGRATFYGAFARVVVVG